MKLILLRAPKRLGLALLCGAVLCDHDNGLLMFCLVIAHSGLTATAQYHFLDVTDSGVTSPVSCYWSASEDEGKAHSHVMRN